MKSTPAMRERAKELATPPRDDFDRAVLWVLNDFDLLVGALRNLVRAARTSGGVAGRDEGLCLACDIAEAALVDATEYKFYIEDKPYRVRSALPTMSVGELLTVAGDPRGCDYGIQWKNDDGDAVFVNAACAVDLRKEPRLYLVPPAWG